MVYLHTKPGQEKVAMRHLETQEYVCYLPMMSVEKVIFDKVEIVEIVMFPHYLFIQLDQGPFAKS